MSKQDILARVKDSMRVNPLHTESPKYTNPLKSAQQDKVQEYIALQNANKAIVIESSKEALTQDIAKALVEVGAQNICIIQI